MSLALLLTALLASAFATEPPALPDMAPSRNAPGWQRQGNSLLLYDESGELVQEHGLQSSEENAGAKIVVNEVTAGASANGRAAWLLERRIGWNYAKSKMLDSRRRLRVFGASGAELWGDSDADAAEQGDPVALSDDGKTALYATRAGVAGSWSLMARDWTGNILMTAGSFPRLMSIALTPNGRFVMARWAVPDKSATHTFLDLKRKLRKDIPSSDMTLGLARVEDDGVVRSGRRVVFELAASTETAK